MHPVMTHLALLARDPAATVAFYRDYCLMNIVHERGEPGTGDHIVWLSEPGRESELILVIIPGSQESIGGAHVVNHLGFALASRAEVDAVAAKARTEGRLVWETRQEPPPVGYFCGVSDPDGLIVEFSYGQPLGPGSPDGWISRDSPDPIRKP